MPIRFFIRLKGVNKMKKYRGSAIVDYFIPTALIGVVVGLGIYYMFDSGMLKKFFLASSDMKIDTSTGTVSVGFKNPQNVTPLISDQNSTQTNFGPSAKCNGTTCDIDLGSLILNGVPDNIPSIETSGGVGETQTNMYASVLDQIAHELAVDNPQVANWIDLLSKTSTNIASMEELITVNDDQLLKQRKQRGIFSFFSSSQTYFDNLSPLYSKLDNFGINSTGNKFKTFWGGLEQENMHDPGFSQKSQTPLYSDKFASEVLNGSGDISQYLQNNPQDVASTYFGIWNEILNSNLSDDVKRAVNYNAAKIADTASNINVGVDTTRTGGSGIFSIFKSKTYSYTLRSNIENKNIETTDYAASVMCHIKKGNDC